MGWVTCPESLGYRAAASHSAEAMDRLAAATWRADVAEPVRRDRDRVCGERQRAEDEREGMRKAEAARM